MQSWLGSIQPELGVWVSRVAVMLAWVCLYVLTLYLSTVSCRNCESACARREGGPGERWGEQQGGSSTLHTAVDRDTYMCV